MVKAGAIGDDPQGGRRVPPGLARDAGRRTAATSRPNGARTRPQRHRRRDGRHRLACGEPGGHRDRAASSRACAPTSAASCPGARLDDDASLLLRFTAARAACCSRRRSPPAARTTCGCGSSAAPARSTGGRRSRTRWSMRRWTAPRRVLTRGSPWLCAAARRAAACRRGIRKAFIEAFANVYLGIAADIEARQARARRDRAGRARLPARRGRRARRALHRERRWSRRAASASGRRGRLDMMVAVPGIAVGTAIPDRPPHRSVRAELPHTAPALGRDAKRSSG